MLKDLGNQKNIEKEAVIAAVKALQSKGWDVNAYTIADELRVPRSLLYRSAEAMDIITQARSESGRPVDVASEQILKRAAELEVHCRDLEVKVAQLSAENEELVRRAQEGWQLGYQAALAESPKARAAHAARQEGEEDKLEEVQSGGFGQTLQNLRLDNAPTTAAPPGEECAMPEFPEADGASFDPRYDWDESASQKTSDTDNSALPPYNFENIETPQGSPTQEHQNQEQENIDSSAEQQHVFGDDPFSSVMNRSEAEESFEFQKSDFQMEPQGESESSTQDADADQQGAEAQEEEESIDPDKLGDLVKRRYQKTGEGAQEPKGLGSKFAQTSRSAEGSHFVMRSVPPDIRKACLMLGVRPEDLSYEQVHQAWKREMTKPGTHPDVGGDTEMAVYLNTAKDVLITWLDTQSPKLGKLFGTGSHQRMQPTNPKEEEST